jgi:hypothetical protein
MKILAPRQAGAWDLCRPAGVYIKIRQIILILVRTGPPSLFYMKLNSHFIVFSKIYQCKKHGCTM